MSATTRYCQECGAPFERGQKGNGQQIDLKRFLEQRYCSNACATATLALARKRTPADRFAASFEPNAAGCWIWTGSQAGEGYGRLKINGVYVKAHRFSYQSFVGPIPDGNEVDHVCRVRSCVNPAHLRAVTSAQNAHNRMANPTSTTGIRGVRQVGARWIAEVRTRREGVMFREQFDTVEQAAEAAEAARIRLLSHYVPGVGTGVSA